MSEHHAIATRALSLDTSWRMPPNPARAAAIVIDVLRQNAHGAMAALWRKGGPKPTISEIIDALLGPSPSPGAE